ncbi:MAG: Uma2 family endonuclease [SAR324 cluster bacterium]|nr:Uma2 family endonuclease [SAR324 cluster bacterium]
MDAIELVKKHSPQNHFSSEESLRVSESAYWQAYYEHPDCQYEWNNGLLEEKPMPDFLSIALYRWFLQLLEEYFKVFPVGQLMGLEMGVRLEFGEKVIIRKPDLAVILNENPCKTNPEDRSFRGVCDLCIEFLSDSSFSEVERDTVVKKEEYAKAGVSEYYILDRLGRHTYFYRLNEQGFYERLDAAEHGVIHSTVLKNFSFRLQDLEGQIPFEALVDNPLYQPFLLKSLQQERQQKEQERQQKEQSLAEVERLRTLLQKKGIDFKEK